MIVSSGGHGKRLKFSMRSRLRLGCRSLLFLAASVSGVSRTIWLLNEGRQSNGLQALFSF